ncbi:tubby-like protein 8 [Dorcoceras hygrometricum]|uniref:Tubby-like protein 8 n=1 Tax=Dorcoceras hygrometricum TaxID=472368 RepID=A0A2Z7CAW1_9LAMI|nr:tubby-like protein 8 [Dorcoceras hygrometricum]
MACCKETTISRQSSCSSSLMYRNPLIERKYSRSYSEGEWYGASLAVRTRNSAFVSDDKENSVPNIRPEKINGKQNIVTENGKKDSFLRESSNGKENLLKPSSFQLCIKKQDPDSSIGLKIWDNFGSDYTDSVNVWDHSDSESAPVSSWSTLPNRSLLCRPLPVDVGRCTCIIVKERLPDEFDGGALYTLYTNEGQGRQNRKLAVAHHRRCKGRSEFTISQNLKAKNIGLDDNLIGIVTANIMGSKYHIWDQARIRFVPTICTWTGSYRSMKAWIPKHHSMQLKNTNQVQHTNGLPTEWEVNKDKVHQLFSRVPRYNKISKQYELDFRDRGGRAGVKLQSSVKNFQLTLERNGKQTILQLGRVAKSKYEMDFRYPLTGYQAFCICLASIDSKLCCTV